MKLERVYHMPELAMMIGWPRHKLVRHLKRMNRDRGGTLLHNSGSAARPIWTTTLDALRATAPQWFRDDETIEARLEELEDARKRDESIINAQTRRVGELSRSVEHLNVVTALLASNLRAIVDA